MDYEKVKAAILASTDIDELKRAQNMPPVPLCGDDENYVFISYSHRDYKAVYCDLLEFHRNGVRYWYDEGLPAGEEWDKFAASKIKGANCAGVIFYMSKNLFLSKSVNKEIEFTVSGGENGDSGKCYFCINLAGMPPRKILHIIENENPYEVLEESGYYDREDVIKGAFKNTATYISKSSDGDIGHMSETIEQIKKRFNVIIDGLPIVNDVDVRKLQAELDFANTFDIENGILYRYKGRATEVIIPDYVTEIGDGAFQVAQGYYAHRDSRRRYPNRERCLCGM